MDSAVAHRYLRLHEQHGRLSAGGGRPGWRRLAARAARARLPQRDSLCDGKRAAKKLCGPALVYLAARGGRTHLLDQVRDGAAALPGSGEPHLNLTHVEDAAAAAWAAFAAPAAFANRAYNVADDCPAPKAEVVAWLAAQLGQPAPRFDPALARATLRRRVVPDRVILNHRLKRELGWQPRYPSYREGYASLLSR